MSAPKPAYSTPYMTKIPGRNPREKAHLTLAHAKNAVSYKIDRYRGTAYPMSIWEWVDSDWRLLYEIPAGSKETPWSKETPAEQKKKRAEAQKAADELEVRKVRRAADVAFHKYMTEHEEGDAEAFVRGFTEGYAVGKTGKFE